MNIKTTLVLVACLALAIAGLLLTRGGAGDGGGDKTDTDTPTNEPPILGVNELGPELQSIQMQHAGQSLRLERAAGRWHIVSPNRFPANTRAIDEVLSILAGLSGQTTPTPPSRTDPNPQSPAVVLGYADRQTSLYLGDRLGNGRAQLRVVRDNRMLACNVSDALHDLFDAFDPRLLYAKSIDAPLLAQTRRIEFEIDGKTSTLTQEDGRWWIVYGASRERALEEQLPEFAGLSTYFKLLDRVEIVEHVDHHSTRGLGAYGLERPLIQTRLIPFDADPENPEAGWTLRVGVPADNDDLTGTPDQYRYVSFGRSGEPHPPVFKVATPIALALGQEATRFRDPRMITTPPTLIESIVITHPDKTLHQITFMSDGTARLSRNNTNAIDIPRRAAEGLTKALHEARASAYPGYEPDTMNPLISIEVRPRLGGTTEQLAVFNDPESDPNQPTALVRRGNEPVVIRIDFSAVAPLLHPATLLPTP